VNAPDAVRHNRLAEADVNNTAKDALVSAMAEALKAAPKFLENPSNIQSAERQDCHSCAIACPVCSSGCTNGPSALSQSK
jgi:hypothetical protein